MNKSTTPDPPRRRARREPATTLKDQERAMELFRGCERFVNGHGPRSTTEYLASVPADTELDLYGNGGVVEALERDVAEMLGTPSALFLISGTMAQQSVLRIHADRRNERAVVFHPACHLDLYEERAYERLHGLVAITRGSEFVALSSELLESVREPFGTLLIELPQRQSGGSLPSWDELVAMVTWARDRGAAVHLDGARLWEAAPFYEASAGKSIRDIVALFDTAYVSFYKGLGAIAGCCVVGDEGTIEELKLWRIRHGGRVFGMWPYAASARSMLHQRSGKFTTYYARAQQIAKSLRTLDGVEVLPYPVQSSIMHVRIHGERAKIEARMLEIARSEKVWMFGNPYAVDGPTLQRYELNVGDATMDFSVRELRVLFERVVSAKR